MVTWRSNPKDKGFTHLVWHKQRSPFLLIRISRTFFVIILVVNLLVNLSLTFSRYFYTPYILRCIFPTGLSSKFCFDLNDEWPFPSYVVCLHSSLSTSFVFNFPNFLYISFCGLSRARTNYLHLILDPTFENKHRPMEISIVVIIPLCSKVYPDLSSLF